METLESIIAAHPFIQGLSAAHVKSLGEYAMRCDFAADEIIFRQGDPANRFYLILEGTVALETRGASGTRTLIQEIGAGDVLGWSWLFPPYYWNFDARAVTPVKAVFFYGTRLRENCEVDHDLGYELMKRMAEIVIVRLQSARKRLAQQNA